MARKKKIDKEMGFRLKQARTEQKLTYEELAEKSARLAELNAQLDMDEKHREPEQDEEPRRSSVLAALETGRVAAYVTDFPNNKIVQGKRVVAIPHLGASSPESEENCAVMAAQELKDYLENGNIRNAVNLPSLVQDWSGETRLCIIHRNVPNMLASVTTVLSREHVNVENMTNKSRGEYAYTIVDVSARVGDAVANELRAIDGILRVRVLNH